MLSQFTYGVGTIFFIFVRHIYKAMNGKRNSLGPHSGICIPAAQSHSLIIVFMFYHVCSVIQCPCDDYVNRVRHDCKRTTQTLRRLCYVVTVRLMETVIFTSVEFYVYCKIQITSALTVYYVSVIAIK